MAKGRTRKTAKAAEKAELCFVVSPIGAPDSVERNHADWLLKGFIEPVFESHFPTIRVERADQISAPGMINSQVINRLYDSRLVIADMTLLNANAFYEMAIRHAVRKPIIHMIRSDFEIPFDVAPHRAIRFSYAHPDHVGHAQSQLRAAIAEALKSDFQVENPITHARGVEMIEEGPATTESVLLEELNGIKSRLSRLERPLPPPPYFPNLGVFPANTHINPVRVPPGHLLGSLLGSDHRLSGEGMDEVFDFSTLTTPDPAPKK